MSLSTLRGSVTWEFEAGQLAGMDRPTLLHPDALIHLVTRLIQQYEHAFLPRFVAIDHETSEISWEPDWASQVRISRLDVTRDIAVPRHLERSFKEALASLNPRYSRGIAQRYENRDGGFTYYNPSGTQGEDRIYNKDAHMKIKGDSGFIRYRVESQVKRERLAKFKMKTLDQVSGDRVWRALESRWKALRLDKPLRNRSQILDLLAELELEQQIDAIAYLGFKTYGAENRLPRRRMTATRKVLRGRGPQPTSGSHGAAVNHDAPAPGDWTARRGAGLYLVMSVLSQRVLGAVLAGFEFDHLVPQPDFVAFGLADVGAKVGQAGPSPLLLRGRAGRTSRP